MSGAPDFRPPQRIVNHKAGVAKVRREGRCRICGTVGKHVSDGGTLTRMHLVPRSQRGDDVDENIVPGCGSGTTGCHGKVEAWDIGTRARLRETLTMEEVAYIVAKKSAEYLEHAYPSTVTYCAERGRVERVVAGCCEGCGEPARTHAFACQVDGAVEAENPRYGPGNPDWARDFERTREP